MSKKMITIAAPGGIILSAAAMGTKDDVHVGPHELVDVPEDYGRHLIDDRFAVAAERPTPVKSTRQGKAEIKAAEKAVSDAEEKLREAGEDTDKVSEAEAELTAARAALDALKN